MVTLGPTAQATLVFPKIQSSSNWNMSSILISKNLIPSLLNIQQISKIRSLKCEPFEFYFFHNLWNSNLEILIFSKFMNQRSRETWKNNFQNIKIKIKTTCSVIILSGSWVNLPANPINRLERWRNWLGNELVISCRVATACNNGASSLVSNG